MDQVVGKTKQAVEKVVDQAKDLVNVNDRCHLNGSRRRSSSSAIAPAAPLTCPLSSSAFPDIIRLLGDVDSDDLTQWQGDFGVNDYSDGDSDGAHFLAWQRQLGSISAVVATAVVPEPRAFLLFVAASAGFCRTAGRKRQELISE